MQGRNLLNASTIVLEHSGAVAVDPGEATADSSAVTEDSAGVGAAADTETEELEAANVDPDETVRVDAVEDPTAADVDADAAAARLVHEDPGTADVLPGVT